jgi:hypothetical protein
MGAQIYACLAKARNTLAEVEIFPRPTAVRLNGDFAQLHHRHFFQIGVGTVPSPSVAVPPIKMAIVGIGGRQIVIVPQREVMLPPACL